MNLNDDHKLKDLLGQWRGLSPRPTFEADVWRRIREPVVESGGWLSQVKAWLGPQPAWVNAVAMLLGVVIGAYAALGPAPARPESALLKPGTMAGNYVSMISGGAR